MDGKGDAGKQAAAAAAVEAVATFEADVVRSPHLSPFPHNYRDIFQSILLSIRISGLKDPVGRFVTFPMGL